ncbi:triphosphoribosyl-dephospho-CoA synthase CitG [Vibrio sp. AK197]
MNAALNLLVGAEHFCEAPIQADRTVRVDLFKLVSELAYHAMLVEVHLTPKPGLVDLLNNGAHSDMDVRLFERSAEAIKPFIYQFLVAGFEHRKHGADHLLSVLRPIGLEAEQAMFKATQGVNTHKGMIFSLGLICGAVGWLKGKSLAVDAVHISHVIKRCCATLVFDELKIAQLQPQSHGEKLFQQYGLTGARGEAASGFATITQFSLPAYEQAIARGQSTEHALWQTLLVLMANNQDTNVVSRGGMHGLRFVQNAAWQLLQQGGSDNPHLEQKLIELNQQFTDRRLSPGGSADLLAMTWLIAQLNHLNQHCQ